MRNCSLQGGINPLLPTLLWPVFYHRSRNYSMTTGKQVGPVTATPSRITLGCKNWKSWNSNLHFVLIAFNGSFPNGFRVKKPPFSFWKEPSDTQPGLVLWGQPHPNSAKILTHQAGFEEREQNGFCSWYFHFLIIGGKSVLRTVYTKIETFSYR